MYIKKLLEKFICFNNIPNICISGISLDINKVKFGNAFFIINNNVNNNYKNIILKSISKGAFFIIKETTIKEKNGFIFYCYNVPIILFYLLNNYLSDISYIYYNNKKKYIKDNIIAITGTNGKTTISFFISQLLKLLNKKTYLINTLGNGNIDFLNKTDYTTDLSFDIQKILYDQSLVNDYIIMEITSHALEQYRIKNIKINISVFSNITHDHLDYHKNILNYKSAKLRLFNDYKSNYNIVNYDDFLGKEIFNNFNDNTLFISTSNESKIYKSHLYMKLIKTIKINNFYILKLNTTFGNGYIKTFLLEKFNIYNILFAISVLLMLNFNIHNVLKLCKFIKLPEGRMNIIRINDSPEIIIDYSHTPDSIEQILKSIKHNYNNKKIFCIFGCGGNRDIIKRHIIYNIINKHSDFFVITSDNPRNEKFNNIVKDMKIKYNYNKMKIIYNRDKAIKFAINFCDNSYIILIIGKGHEKYQIIKNNKKIFHYDKDSVINELKKIY